MDMQLVWDIHTRVPRDEVTGKDDQSVGDT